MFLWISDDAVTSSDVSDLLTGDRKTISDFLVKLFGGSGFVDDDFTIVEYVCNLLSERCALLVRK
jgi:hypothetical protein